MIESLIIHADTGRKRLAVQVVEQFLPRLFAWVFPQNLASLDGKRGRTSRERTFGGGQAEKKKGYNKNPDLPHVSKAQWLDSG